MREQTPRAVAVRIADHLVQSTTGIDAVCLFGSVARGSDRAGSDLDLLVLGRGSLTSSTLQKSLPKELRYPRLSLIYYPTEVFAQRCREGALFAAHLRREGQILYDRDDILARILRGSRDAEADWGKQIAAELARVRFQRDIKRLNGNHLFFLADIYTAAKGLVMLGLAKRGIFEFDRNRAFARYAHLHPNRRGAIDSVRQLEPFYRIVTRRPHEPLPFPYDGDPRPVRRAVTAVRRLAKHVAAE